MFHFHKLCEGGGQKKSAFNVNKPTGLWGTFANMAL
jgi:hypothetical protein